MSYNLKYDVVAESSLIEETNFILTKWNIEEVYKFELLVENELRRLCLNPRIGILKHSNIYSLVISKQTTIYYRINEINKFIEVIVFWNNLKNPNDLAKFL